MLLIFMSTTCQISLSALKYRNHAVNILFSHQKHKQNYKNVAYMFYNFIPYNSAYFFAPSPGGGPILIHRSHHSHFLLTHPIGGTSKRYLLAGTRIIGSIATLTSFNSKTGLGQTYRTLNLPTYHNPYTILRLSLFVTLVCCGLKSHLPSTLLVFISSQAGSILPSALAHLDHFYIATVNNINITIKHSSLHQASCKAHPLKGAFSDRHASSLQTKILFRGLPKMQAWPKTVEPSYKDGACSVR